MQGERRKTTRRGLKCATPSELFLSSQCFVRRVHCVCTTCYRNFYTYMNIIYVECDILIIIYTLYILNGTQWFSYLRSGRVIVFNVIFLFLFSSRCLIIILCVCVFVYGNILTTIYIDAGTVFGDLYEHDSAHGKQRKPRRPRRPRRRL